MILLQSLESDRIDSVPKLYMHLAGLFSRGTTSPLHIFVTFSKTSIEKLPSNADGMGRRIQVEFLGDNLYEIKLRLKKRGASGWLVTKENVWLFFIKAQESSSIGAMMEAWISGMNPFISHARIPPNGLFDLLDSLDKANGDGIRIHAFYARSYRQDKAYDSIREGESQKGWTGAKYDRRKLERTIAASNTVLYAAKLEFPDTDTSFVARVSRRGHITFYEGQEQGFSNFYTRLIDPYVRNAVVYDATLDNKQVQIKELKSIVSPIIFEPARTLGKSDFDDMIDAVTREPDFMVSVVHFGNPWLYLTVVDRADGSACEIYGFEDEIQIIPQFKATSTALARFEDIIYGVFPSVTKTSE